jgi:hypothetical protein
MSYTLRGRLESRLAAGLLPLLVAALAAAALREWWPLGIAGVMLVVGLALDALVFHRLLPYQPGWLALPLGVVELALVMALARGVGIDAPLSAALGLFVGAWVVAQLCAHALFPLVRLTYGEDGGELGRLGTLAAAAALAVVSFAGGVAWATAPPTVRLEAGVHRGPLVLAEAQTLVGEPGAVVEGGIVIRADDVTVRNVTVRGGEVGISVEEAIDVVLEDVTVLGPALDGISSRLSSVRIRGCVVRDLAPEHTQAIDLSFAATLPPSRIEGCWIEGGAEGITTQMVNADVRDNVVTGTTLRAISINEMSRATVEGNVVRDARGIGILCTDYSMCEIARNQVTGTRADPTRGRSSAGHAIVSHYFSAAMLRENVVARNEGDVAAFVNATLSRR